MYLPVVLVLLCIAAVANAQESYSIPLRGAYGNIAGCEEQTGETDNYLALTSEGVSGWEWHCEFTSVGEQFSNYWQIRASCTGEGDEWQDTITIIEDPATDAAIFHRAYDSMMRLVDLCSLPLQVRQQRELRRRGGG